MPVLKEDKSRLIVNFIYLSLVQGANYLLPLVTVPHLVKVLGPDVFGMLTFVNVVTMYFVLITDYGFNLSATQQISLWRHDRYKISEIAGSVIIVKLFLMLVSFFLMTLLVFSFGKFRLNWNIYYINFGIVIGSAIFPSWLFQGLEKMAYITYLNIGAKVFFTLCIFLCVKNSSDYYLVPLFTSLGYLLSGILSLYFVKKHLHVSLKFSSFSNLKYQLKDGWDVFSSSMAISLYTISSTFLLGIFTNNTLVGQYAIADKIIQAVKGVYIPMAQSMYPFLGKKLRENREVGFEIINRITLIIGVFMFLISTILFFQAERIIIMMFGTDYYDAILLLKIMAFLPVIISLSNIFGIQTMLNLGFKKQFSSIIYVSAVVGFLILYFVTPIFKANGLAFAVLFIEIFTMLRLGRFVYLIRKGPVKI